MSREVRHHLTVTLERPEVEQALRAENERLRAELKKNAQTVHHLESRLGEEIYLNCELVDILKAHGIKYRQLLDYREREKRHGRP